MVVAGHQADVGVLVQSRYTVRECPEGAESAHQIVQPSAGDELRVEAGKALQKFGKNWQKIKLLKGFHNY